MHTWSDQDTKLAKVLCDARAPDEEFRAKLGVTKVAAESQLRYRQLFKSQARRESRPSIWCVPRHVIVDAKRRETLRAAMPYFTRQFGDPPPGYTALDRNNGTYLGYDHEQPTQTRDAWSF